MNFKLIAMGIICASFMAGSLAYCAEDDRGAPVERVDSLEDILKGRESTGKDEEKATVVADEEEGSKEERMANAITFITKHPGAEHHAMKVTYFGDYVDLEDGSVWLVSESDRRKTLDWYTSDIIAVTPNYNWFSSYDYTLVNTKTDDIVEVKLIKKPFLNGPYAFWVNAIDYRDSKICLNDGSLWKTSFFDDSKLRSWQPDDTVIIGINTGIFSGDQYPNILINVDTTPVSYIPCNCYY